jgi:hypothetical protein
MNELFTKRTKIIIGFVNEVLKEQQQNEINCEIIIIWCTY